MSPLRPLLRGVGVLALALLAALTGHAAARITIDYPAEGTIFPPEFPPPLFQWRDAESTAATWLIEVDFGDGSPRRQIGRRADAHRPH